MRIMLKYNIQVKDVPHTGKTWMIFTEWDDDGSYEDIIYTDHIELKVPIKTLEKSWSGVFGMECEGVVSFKEHPSQPNGFVVITKE